HRGVFLGHPRADRDAVQDDVEIGLRLRAAGRATNRTQLGVVADIEAALLGVEGLRAILVGDVNGAVRLLGDHEVVVTQAGCADFFKRARRSAGSSPECRAPGSRGFARTAAPRVATRVARGRCGGETSTKTCRDSRTRPRSRSR